MRRRSETRGRVGVEVTVHLQPARQNGTVHVHGSVEVGDVSVPFSGWLDLLDSLERVAERHLDSSPPDAAGPGGTTGPDTAGPGGTAGTDTRPGEGDRG